MNKLIRFLFLVIAIVLIGYGIYGYLDTDAPKKGIKNGADLEITTVTDMDAVQVGDILTYTHTIKNLGELDAKNLTITSNAPKGTSIVSVGISKFNKGFDEDTGKCEDIEDLAICKTEILYSGAYVTVDVSVAIDEAMSDTIINGVVVSSEDNSSDPQENNLASITTIVKESEGEIYNGYACGFAKIIVKNEDDTSMIYAHFFPEISGQNKDILFTGTFPSYEANGISLYQDFADDPTNNVKTTLSFSSNKNEITITGIQEATKKQLCKGSFTKNVLR